MKLAPLSPARSFTSCLGLGLLRPAPGTIGSAFGLILFMTLLASRSVLLQVIATLILTVVGAMAATITERELGHEDPSEVVIDEVAGMWVALWSTSSWGLGIVAFLLFRILDIVKPFPARQAESLHGGWGIMLDDLMAGLYALILVRLAAAWLVSP